MSGPDGLPGLVDMKLHPVEFPQQIVRKLNVSLIDFVDQEHRWLGRFKGLPQHPPNNVVRDISYAFVTEL